MKASQPQWGHTAYDRIAQIGKLLSDPVRLEIIELLAQGEWTVEALAKALELPGKNISHHLQRLYAAHLVLRDKRGREVHYRLSDPSVATFWATFRAFVEALTPPDLSRFFTNLTKEQKNLSAEQLAGIIAHGEVTIIDVRPHAEFAAGHIQGALSFPEDSVGDHLSELPRNRPVVAFCRGPYCHLADRAVRLLRERGHIAVRCTGGVSEWLATGRPLSTST